MPELNSKQLARRWPYKRHKEFERELRTAAKQWFSAKGYAVHPKMPYCLDKWENWQKNIILKEVADDIFKHKQEKDKKSFPLHKYVHHGLSSQAMVFNLIGPLIVRDNLKPLTDLLKNKGIDINLINHAEFEYEERLIFNEDSGQPTSLDLVLFDNEHNPKIFIESKLVEAENPLGDKTECYLHFIGRKYWDLIEKYGFDEKLRNEKICIFVNYYQFFREVLFSLEKGGVFVLLYDERSSVFHHKTKDRDKGLIPLLLDFVPDEHKDKIALLSIQEVIDSVSGYRMHKDWVDEFRLKYGLADDHKN